MHKYLVRERTAQIGKMHAMLSEATHPPLKNLPESFGRIHQLHAGFKDAFAQSEHIAKRLGEETTHSLSLRLGVEHSFCFPFL